MSESDLLKKVYAALTQLKQQGRKIKWVKYHGSGYSQANTPDLHITLDGCSYWIELKKLGEEPTAGQYHELREWAGAGSITGWADSVEKVLEILSCK